MILKPCALLEILLVFVFGAVHIINVHAHEKADNSTGRTGGYKSEDGRGDGKLEFHGLLWL